MGLADQEVAHWPRHIYNICARATHVNKLVQGSHFFRRPRHQSIYQLIGGLVDCCVQYRWRVPRCVFWVYGIEHNEDNSVWIWKVSRIIMNLTLMILKHIIASLNVRWYEEFCGNMKIGETFWDLKSVYMKTLKFADEKCIVWVSEHNWISPKLPHWDEFNLHLYEMS